MHLIVCIDDRDGMSFCGKRLSSDRFVTERILRLTSGSLLWMHPYSQPLFAGRSVCPDEDFLQKCGKGEFCFAENVPVTVKNDSVESVTLFRWNRHYPATLKFPRELLAGFRLVHTEDFPGNSHDKISVERYIP